MSLISTTDAQGLSTKAMIAAYRERISPTNFLRSFFPNKVTGAKEVSIQVRRGFEKIAVDVQRGSDGNKNRWSLSTEKIFVPPYFKEFFDSTELQLYDRLYGATEIDDATFAALINDIVDHQMELQEKIERTYELYCSQVLESGIVQLKQGINIDFKRKSASLVDDGAGQYFADAIDPFKKFETGCKFMREKGKSGDAVFNALCGDAALADLLANAKFLTRQNLFNMSLDQVTGPARNNAGATFHGIITAGSYKVQLWAYPQVYDDPDTSASTPYLNSKKVIMIPSNPRFHFAFGGVPQLLKPGTPPQVGAFIFSDYIDEKHKTHEYYVESAGVPVPVAIDQIYTFKAVA